MKKLYIDGPDDGGEGIYNLIADDGEFLANHFCSAKRFALGDLERDRPERQQEWHQKFGEYQVLRLGQDDMTRVRLRELNKAWFERAQADVSKPVEPTRNRDFDSEMSSDTDAESHTHRFNGDIHGIPTGKCLDCGVDYQDWLKSLPEKSQ